MVAVIVSASRRTDVPAFFGGWFMKRLQEGYVMVRNPLNRSHVRRVELTPDQVDCIVLDKEPYAVPVICLSLMLWVIRIIFNIPSTLIPSRSREDCRVAWTD